MASFKTDPKRPEFVMEVTDKTKADVKGGKLQIYTGVLSFLNGRELKGP